MSIAPRVSVVLPARNALRYLDEAVRSILDQTFRDFELILIDDGSTDGTGERCESLAATDSRIRVIHTAGLGLIGALNLGVAEARAPLIARMDADDISLPERLDHSVKFLDEHPEVGAVSGWVRIMSMKGKLADTLRFALNHEDIERLMLEGKNQMVHPGVLMRRELFDRAGGYNPDRPNVEDYDLWLRMSEITRLANLPEILVHYRVHADSVSQANYGVRTDAAQSALDAALLRRGLGHLHPRVFRSPARLIRMRQYRYRGQTLRWIATIAAGVLDPPFRRWAIPRLRFLLSGRVVHHAANDETQFRGKER